MQETNLLTKEELAKLLKVSGRTIENWERAGLPSYKLSPKVRRYKWTEVWTWITEEKAEPSTNTEGQP